VTRWRAPWRSDALRERPSRAVRRASPGVHSPRNHMDVCTVATRRCNASRRTRSLRSGFRHAKAKGTFSATRDGAHRLCQRGEVRGACASVVATSTTSAMESTASWSYALCASRRQRADVHALWGAACGRRVRRLLLVLGWAVRKVGDDGWRGYARRLNVQRVGLERAHSVWFLGRRLAIRSMRQRKHNQS